MNKVYDILGNQLAVGDLIVFSGISYAITIGTIATIGEGNHVMITPILRKSSRDYKRDPSSSVLKLSKYWALPEDSQYGQHHRQRTDITGKIVQEHHLVANIRGSVVNYDRLTRPRLTVSKISHFCPKGGVFVCDMITVNEQLITVGNPRYLGDFLILGDKLQDRILHMKLKRS